MLLRVFISSIEGVGVESSKTLPAQKSDLVPFINNYSLNKDIGFLRKNFFLIIFLFLSFSGGKPPLSWKKISKVPQISLSILSIVNR